MSRAPVVVAISLALSAGLQACGPADTRPQAEQKPRAVVAQPVRYESVTATRTLVGIVRPRVESDLGFRIGGKIAERLVQPGDAVRQGTVLARLDPTDLGLQREQAEAEVTAARASLAQADSEDRRIAALRREGWSTASAQERQRALLEEARGRVHRAERALGLATNALAYATLAADADGIVTAAPVEPGQVVAAGQMAIRLARSDGREAQVAVPEVLVDRVRTAAATVSFWSEPGASLPARLREMAASADPVTRTFQARFAIEGEASADFGQTATVTLRTRAAQPVARLPLSALFNQGQGPSLFVVDPKEGLLTLKPVEVAAYEGRDVLIRGGVAEGDMVVTLGVQKLDVKQRVRLARSEQ
jgi:RND family efflux transporter MFP subunit